MKHINGEQYNIDTLVTNTNQNNETLFSCDRWFETAAVPVGATHVADSIGSGGGSFQIDAGDDQWGDWVLVLGSEDTPYISGKTYFKVFRLMLTTAERNADYFIQLAGGEDPDAAVASGIYYAEVPVKPLSNQIDSGPIEVNTKRCGVGTKVWVRCKCPGQNTGTLNFYIGITEYDK